jgi:Ran GTPase-activating protein (RanGAP) involved in mRNA processing and transport
MIIVFLLEAVSKNSCLIRLDVSNNPINEGVRGFHEFSLMNIVTLQMNNCGINDLYLSIVLKGLQTNNSLRILELNQNEITNDSINDVKEFFDKNSTLKTIYLLNNQIEKNALSNVLRSADLIKIVSD